MKYKYMYSTPVGLSQTGYKAKIKFKILIKKINQVILDIHTPPLLWKAHLHC